MPIPIRNLYYLLCYAYDALDLLGEAPASGIEGPTPADLFARVLSHGTATLLRRGLDRNYVAHDEELRNPRGRIDVSKTVKRALESRGRVACDLDDLVADILPNQILRSTIQNLADGGIDLDAREQCAVVLERLGPLSPLQLRPDVFRRARRLRMGLMSRTLVAWCELVYKALLPKEGGKGSPFQDFWRQEGAMRTLFEAFVRGFYRREMPELGATSERFAWHGVALDPSSGAVLPMMKTDVSLNSHSKVVIDTKFVPEALKPGQFGGVRLRSEHLYQLMAYLTNLTAYAKCTPGEVKGVLLYPVIEAPFRYRYELLGHTVEARSLNLDREWPEIRRELEAIAALRS